MNKPYDVYMCREPDITSLIGVLKGNCCKKFLIRCRKYADSVGKKTVVIVDTESNIIVSAYYK